METHTWVQLHFTHGAVAFLHGGDTDMVQLHFYMGAITGQYCATLFHEISPWSCLVLELYVVAKHNTINTSTQGRVVVGD